MTLVGELEFDFVTALSVTFCPITAFVERVVLSITAFGAPNVVVTLGDCNYIVHGERDVDALLIQGFDKFGCFVEFGAPFAITCAVVSGNVNDGVQFNLVLDGKDVLNHFVPSLCCMDELLIQLAYIAIKSYATFYCYVC